MKKELIKELFSQFESAKETQNNVEYWSARNIQTILGYAQWKNFEKVIEKAKNTCRNSGIEPENHFADVGKMVETGSGVNHEIQDTALTRLTESIYQHIDYHTKKIGLR